jgi:16S rRNA G527 N7-methylase RsmG
LHNFPQPDVILKVHTRSPIEPQSKKLRFLPMAKVNLSMSEYTIAKANSEVFESYNLADYLNSDLK